MYYMEKLKNTSKTMLSPLRPVCVCVVHHSRRGWRHDETPRIKLGVLSSDGNHELYLRHSPNLCAHSSCSRSVSGLTLGRMDARLASKSASPMGRILSTGIWSSASPRDRRGPMAASFARAAKSDPEYPVTISIFDSHGQGRVMYSPSVRVTSLSISWSVRVWFC